MRYFVCFIIVMFLIGFWPAFGLTINDNQAKAILEGIKQLEKERDEAREAARYWKDKASRLCT